MKYLILALLVLSNVNAMAMSCLQEDSLQEFSAEILETAAIVGECPTDEEIILKLVNDEYKKFYGDLKQITKTVKGFSLKGSAKELSIAEELLGAKPPKAWAAAAKDCETIQCAFEKLFKSKEAAMQIFNIRAKSGYNFSLDQSINQNMADQIWSAKEIREMDSMISKLPPELRNLPHLKTIERMGDGLRKGDHERNVAAYASPYYFGIKRADLVSYDAGMHGVSTNKNPYESTSWPQEAITHELCHHHDFKGIGVSFGSYTSEKPNAGFKTLSGWKETTNKKGESIWTHSKTSKFVSNYAETSPAEDYAETCMNYLLHPEELAKKAPEKYAYMKKNLFNNAEFKDKKWAKPIGTDWPIVNELIADESGCEDGILKCSENIKYEYGNYTSAVVTRTGNTTSTVTSSGSLEAMVNNNPCYKEFKKLKAKGLSETILKEENFCEKGGPKVISTLDTKLCKKTLDNFGKALVQISAIKLEPFIKTCEAQKDFTSDCILSGAIADAKLSEPYAKRIKSVLEPKIPSRMNALANELGKLNSGVTIRACLEGVATVDAFSTTDGKVIYDYNSTDKEYTSGYLGKYIYDDYNRKDINQKCGESLLGVLQEQGYKTPTTGSKVNLMKKPFLDEFQSFENEVIGQIKARTNKCLMSKCRIQKITEILIEWEKKSPEKRAGVGTAEFAETLHKKTKLLKPLGF